MATTTFTAAPRNNTDAEFRAWGGGLSTALAAVGLVKTSDTGQINWTTVPAPTATNTIMGYEIWRLNDSLQATAPFYFKIEYGSSSVIANIAMKITIGKGSDGAGAITGSIMSATNLNTSGSNATPSSWYVSGGDGSMLGVVAAVGHFTGGGSTCNFVFDRSRAANQSATGVGAHLAHAVGTATVTVKVFNHAAATIYTPTVWPVIIPYQSGATTLAAGGKAPLFPALLTDGLGNYWQPRSSLVGLSVDMGSFVPMTVTGFGTYMGMGSGSAAYDSLISPNARLAMLWE